MPLYYHLQTLAIALLCVLSVNVFAKQEHTLQSILAMQNTPDGVVIEIVTGDNAGLSWALPKAEDYIKQLRQKFKDLPIAIVTHGREQFALTKSNQASNNREHQAVRSLTQGSNVQVHVCGTYAGWRDLSENDFPDYVNVSAAGPAQINDYVAVGYLRLVIRSAKKKAK